MRAPSGITQPKVAPLLVVMGGVALSLALLLALLSRAEHLQREELRGIARERAAVLQSQLLRSTEVLHSVAALFGTRGEVSRAEFGRFVAGALARQPELQALAWDAHVSRADRPEFEARARAEGFRDFRFTDDDTRGGRIPSGNRNEHFPVFYLEPLDRNADALGFDVGSEPQRRAALEAARDTGALAATAPVRLAQEKGSQLGFLVFEPIYRDAPASLEQRRAQLTGFAVAVFRIGDLVEASLHTARLGSFHLHLRDEASGATIYERPRRIESSKENYLEALDIAGRRWELILQAGGAVSAGTWAAWAAFVAGLIITALLGAYLWSRERNAAALALSNAALVMEVAERKRAEAAAESANRAKSEFLANMSHEIRTPMNAILGYAQILARDASMHPFQRDAIATIGSSCDHLLHLIDEILDLSKIDAGHVALVQNEFSPVALARELICLFQQQCEDKGLGLRFEGPEDGDGLLVRGDPGKLRQVLINLLGNAVKFTEAGRVTLRMLLAGENAWHFEIEDTGVGIALESHAAVFEPFQQGAPGQGGTGLGLTIAQRHVKLMGGRLELASTAGEGARFFFTLRLAPAAQHVLASPERIVERLASGVQVRALVVDDIAENREVLALLLRAIGCEVGLGETGRQAVEAVRLSRPDIVFMDMRLPDADGVEITRRLMQEWGPSGLKIVVTSASALAHQRERYLETGCHEFVAKPFRAEAIYRCLENVLGAQFEYRPSPEREGPAEIVNLSSIALPESLATRLMMAAELHSATVLKTCLAEVEALGPAGARLAQHLRSFLASYDMATIQRLVAQIPIEAVQADDTANAA